MVLNSTNLHVAAKVLASDNTDDWRGKEIILFTDPNVSFKGEVVGGLRFRGQEKAPVKAAARKVPGKGSPATPGRFNEMPDDLAWEEDEPGARG